MAHTDEILVKNMHINDTGDVQSSGDQSTTHLTSSLNTSKAKLSRNNSSTFSSKSHYSMPSGVLVSKNSATESLNDSLVNPLSIKRIVNLATNSNSQAPINLSSIDYTVVTSTNPQGRLGTFDTVSATSTSNRSLYSFNRIAHVGNTSARESISNGIEELSVIDVRDPVIIRGAGNITIFGVSNKFNESFPSQLYSKLAPEEFRDTVKQINSILTRELANSFRWLVFGSVFCCCTLGCSLFPVIFINKKARLSINKFLSIENQRMYLKLGLKWRLAKIKCNSNSLMEYVLLIEFLPTVVLYHPD